MAQKLEDARAQALLQTRLRMDSTLSVDSLMETPRHQQDKTVMTEDPEMLALNDMLAEAEAKLQLEKDKSLERAQVEDAKRQAELDATAAWEHERIVKLAEVKAAAADAAWLALAEEDDMKHIKVLLAQHRGTQPYSYDLTFTEAGDAEDLGLELGCLTEAHRKELDPAAPQFAYVHKASRMALKSGVQVYDIITAINGNGATGMDAQSVSNVNEAIRNASRPVSITIQRGAPPRRAEDSSCSTCVLS